MHSNKNKKNTKTILHNILKISCAIKIFLLKILRKKKRQKYAKSHMKGVLTCKKKYVKILKTKTFLVWFYTSQNFAQIQQNLAPSRPVTGETVIFRNSFSTLATFTKKYIYIYICTLNLDLET